MKAEEVYRALREADPASPERMAGLELWSAEAALAEEILAEPAVGSADDAAGPWPGAGRRHRRGLLGLAAATVAAAAVALVLLFGGGTSEAPSSAYGAELVRFAESTPLLLLEGPGWRVQDAVEHNAEEGRMEFVTGRPVPYETIWIRGSSKRPRASGMLSPAVRQRRVELRWNQRGLAEALEAVRRMPHPHGRHWVEAPVLDTTAKVDTRAEFFVNLGGPGNRQMTAIWSEGGYVLELSAAVPDLAAFEERLGWLEKVDSESWLDAMPAKVVKAADHDAAVRGMLKGIPVPAGFDPSQVPDEGLTTNRYQVGGAVTGTVACLWFRQWGEARRTGDREAAAEAERAMATSRHWPILREMASDGAYPNLIWELAARMPSGKWRRGWRLLPHAEALGCARRGIPVLPWKQRRQQEREAGA